MSETLWAVIIGGAIAVIGSAVTQIVLFLLNDRKEADKRHREMVYKVIHARAKLIVIAEAANMVKNQSADNIFGAAAGDLEQIDELNDNELMAYLGVLEQSIIKTSKGG